MEGWSRRGHRGAYRGHRDVADEGIPAHCRPRDKDVRWRRARSALACSEARDAVAGGYGFVTGAWRRAHGGVYGDAVQRALYGARECDDGAGGGGPPYRLHDAEQACREERYGCGARGGRGLEQEEGRRRRWREETGEGARGEEG